ncbi:IspD/TarI family cytidylyltransferase [Alicyclobacillus acidiphilus]|uniref:IspD/TarI family cytidylyltransferase n=1 Tax=Alicyclobacillus acidiphilus TaxID=182455 RepID=UPI0012ECD295|nr:IspD/TarI family cytidylyltransferase [Alicyclobacillus acidiphilus]
MRFAIVVAAGQGRRMGFKKQFLNLAGKSMWLRSTEAMLCSGVSHVIVVASEEDWPRMESEISTLDNPARVRLTRGGATRHDSVVAGMQVVRGLLEAMALPPSEALVAVHDAARPFVSIADVDQVFEQAAVHGGALLGRYSRDTVKWVQDDRVDRTIPRERVFLAETPQVVRGDFIEQAYFAQEVSDSPTDDSAILESLGVKVACVESTGYNGKVTTPSDLDYAQWLSIRLWGNVEA